VKRRRLELAVLAFGFLFVGVILLSFQPGRRPSPAASGASPAPGAGPAGEATAVLSGVDFTETLRGKPVFRIRSDRTVGFGPGAGLDPNWYALEKVALTVYPDQGSPVTVLADRAEYDDRSKAARLTGNVRWSDEAGTLGQTDRVEFDPASRVLRVPSPVRLDRGTFQISAPSGRYEVAARSVFLDGPVRGAGSGEGTGGISSLSAGEGVYRRDEATVELSGDVAVATRAGDRLESERLAIRLSPADGGVEWIRAWGNVRGALAASAAPSRAPAPRTYAGAEGAFSFAPGGQLRSLALTGAPARVEEPGRRIQARSIGLAFASGRPVSGQARGAVRVFTPEMQSESERADTSFGEGGEIDTLVLSEKVRLRGEGRSGSGDRLVEVASRGTSILTADASRSAVVEREGSRLSAFRIEVDRTRRTLRGEGNARALFRPSPGGGDRAVTPVGDPSRPTYGKAERIVLDEASRLAILSGGAALWQGASSLAADDITLNDAERTAVAVGGVRALFTPARPDEGKGIGRPEPTVITARRLLWREPEGTARLEGGVTATRGTFRASGREGIAYLDGDRKVKRVELVGDVYLADRAAGRTGKAERAIDFPQEGRTILHGSPARVADAEGNQVAGATLTIADRGRRVEVAPPEGGRTETVHRTRAD
jgi:lipopolysaccharide export system protein LptA